MNRYMYNIVLILLMSIFINFHLATFPVHKENKLKIIFSQLHKKKLN